MAASAGAERSRACSAPRRSTVSRYAWIRAQFAISLLDGGEGCDHHLRQIVLQRGVAFIGIALRNRLRRLIRQRGEIVSKFATPGRVSGS